ncbi:MAG: hypothetical protein FJY66_03755, partial [Calditrichaeota bacterium]|nr:hypothetical protein [Calditrichota bacterium]
MAKLVPSLTLLVAFLFLFGCTDDNNPATSFQVGPASLFVANMTTLSVINLETATVANDIFGLGNAPNDMIVAANTLIVLNSISNDLNFFRVNRDGSLSVDGTADVGLAQNNNPWAAAMDGSGHLLITNMMQNSISVFSLTSRTIERTVPAGIAPGPILVLGNHAYVGNTGYDFGTYSYGVGTIWKYDLETGSIVDSIEVGTNPQDVGLDPLGQLHVVCTGNYADIPGRIYVVQPA